MKFDRVQKTKKRATRTRQTLRRKDLSGRVRLSVYRSGENIYAQLIDDSKGVTLASSSSMEKALKKSMTGTGVENAGKVGTDIAKKAKTAGVTEVYFDRGGYRYHGRVKALAEAARAGGLSF